MTAASRGMPKAFKRALLFSALLHVGLLIFIVASPSLPRSRPKGLIQYVSLVSFPGGGGPGGGGGGGTPAQAEPLPSPKPRETLRDLTVPGKAKADEKPGLRFPVDKPKTAKKAPEKKAVITKPEPGAAAAAGSVAASGAPTGGPGQGGAGGPGYGLRFGTGPGGPGTGGGAGGGEPFGVSGFPFNYYLQFLSEKISASWFTSLVDPGVSGQFQAQVYFKVFRNGQVGDLKVEVSSGVPAFDLSALRAIQTASPFAPLPSEYDGQYLGIHLIFEHSR
ncbi:MAG TPA: TonB family protein [Terriglobales bacterium]|nr:TonB family protein [Terriglobales bacterium]